jgi:phosphopantothenoylcysteine synthetase/decarboxylase
VHSAAVADYKLKKFYLHKVKSGMRNWKIRLVPTERIIDLIKKVSPPLFLVGFKFKTQATKDTLIKESKRLMQRAKSDLVVANSIYKNKYRAFIVDNTHVYGPMKNKQSLVGDLVRLISEKT